MLVARRCGRFRQHASVSVRSAVRFIYAFQSVGNVEKCSQKRNMGGTRYCCVVGCKNSQPRNRELTFYSFPRRSWEIQKRNDWIKAVRRLTLDKKPWQSTINTRICSAHFVGGKQSNIENSPAYVPTIFPPVYKKNAKSLLDLARHERLLKRKEKKSTSTASKPQEKENIASDIEMGLNETPKEAGSTNIACPTDACVYEEEGEKGNTFWCWNNDRNEASTQTNIYIGKPHENERIIVKGLKTVATKSCGPDDIFYVTMDTNDLKKVKAEVVHVDNNTPICRCCLATDRRLAKLKDFCFLLLDLTGIVSESDDLPKYICWECAALLRKAVRFKQQVLQAHSILSDFNNRCTPFAIDAKHPELTQYSPLLLAKTPMLTFCSDSGNKMGFHDVLQHKAREPLGLVPLQDVSKDIKNENEIPFIQIEVKEERVLTDSDNDLTLHICDGTMNSEDSEEEYLVERKPRERRKVKSKRRDDTTSDSDDSMTPPEITRTARAVIESLLPEKSKRKYDKAYKDFIDWKSKKNAPSFSENVMLTYFSEKAQKYQPSSLWSMYSMLKSTLMAKDDVNIVEYRNLTAFLKRRSQGFRGKKTKVLTTEDIYSFLQNAPDDKYLLMKVVLIMGVNGACRTQELTQLTTDHIEIQENVIIVTLPSTKTKIQRSFVLSDLFYEIVKKYTLLRPDDVPTNRFFLQYRESKCVKQVLGKNKICSMPKAIAAYLNLQNSEEYTGYCFRKTAAAILPGIRSNVSTMKPSAT